MIVLSPAIIEEKNKIEGDGVWILLLDLVSPDLVYHLRLAQNTEDVEYLGETYQAFPFQLGEITDESKGRVSGVPLKVSNIDRLVQGYIEQDATFGSDWDVTISLVNTELMDTEDFTPLSRKFKSKGVVCDSKYATFGLGGPSPLKIQTPSQKYSSNSCQRTFNDGRGCPYSTKGSGSFTNCNGTLAECKLRYPNGIIEGTRKLGFPFNGKLGMTQQAIYK